MQNKFLPKACVAKCQAPAQDGRQMHLHRPVTNATCEVAGDVTQYSKRKRLLPLST